MKKIYFYEDLLYLTATSHADYTIAWSSNATTGDNNYARLSDCNEFNQYENLYRQYRVVGMKWSCYPNQQVNTPASATVVQGIATCHQMDILPTGAMAEDTLWGQETFKMHPYRACRGYVNVRRYNKSVDSDWLATGTYGPNGGTLIRLLANGYADLTIMGKVVTCYYV